VLCLPYLCGCQLPMSIILIKRLVCQFGATVVCTYMCDVRAVLWCELCCVRTINIELLRTWPSITGTRGHRIEPDIPDRRGLPTHHSSRDDTGGAVGNFNPFGDPSLFSMQRKRQLSFVHSTVVIDSSKGQSE
jgi:hypothetical protein